MNKLVIYGCGGHARSVADVALYNGFDQLIFIDKNARENEKLFGFDVVKVLAESHQHDCIIALGDNHERAGVFDELTLKQHKIISLIADDAYIGQNAELAPGVFVGHAAHIGPNATIGAATVVNTRSIIEHDCCIGKHCHISVNAIVAGKSQIGDHVMLGAGAVVIDGLKICSNVTIGAGAVVVSDITEPGTYVGVPARMVSGSCS